MLLQLSEALQGHSQKQFLGLFDLNRMKDGPLFKQQINSFFGQAESIRVHLNLMDTSFDGDKANLAVDAEMEAASVTLEVDPDGVAASILHRDSLDD